MQKYVRNMQYKRCRGICTNMQMRYMQYMSMISQNMSIYNICILYADIFVICLNMYRGKYALICKLKNVEICMKYAAICSTNYYQICRKCQELYKYANNKYPIYVHNKLKYAEICKKICTYMQTYHMHNLA